MKVQEVNYSIYRNVNAAGQPASDPQRPMITLTVEATDKSDILESLLNSKYKKIKGEVIFNQASLEGKLIKLNFTNGFVIHHEVIFNALNEQSMLLKFTVSAENIIYGNAEYNGYWAGSDQSGS